MPLPALPPTAQNPLMPRALRAFCTAAVHLFCLPRADAFLDTMRPFLFLVRAEFARPPTVFANLPLKTARLALAVRLYLRIDTFMARRFIDFFIDFFAFFIAFMAFFIDRRRMAMVWGCCSVV